MALEIMDGYPSVLMDYGSGTKRANHSEIRLNDGNLHHIDVIWNNQVPTYDSFIQLYLNICNGLDKSMY